METNEIMEVEELTTVEDVEIYEESEGSVVGTVLKVVAGAAIAAGGILLYKGRNKITDWNIKRLEKKGYVITKPESEVEKTMDEESEDID